MTGVARRERLEFASVLKFFKRIQPHGVRKPVTRNSGAGHIPQHRMTLQLHERLPNRLRLQPVTPDDIHCGFARKSLIEGCQTTQCRLFARAQALMTPVKRSPERLMTGHSRASPLRQPLNALLQTSLQTRQCKGIDLRCRQFQRQRDAIELATEVTDDVHVTVPQDQTLLAGLGATDEQLHRRISQALLDTDLRGRRRNGQRLQWKQRFVTQVQRSSTGGKNGQLIGLRQQRAEPLPTAFVERFAVVGNQQTPPLCQLAGQARQARFAVPLQELGQAACQHLLTVHRREIDDTHAILIARHQTFGYAAGHGRFADASRAGQRDEAFCRQLSNQLAHHIIAPHDMGEAYRQVVGDMDRLGLFRRRSLLNLCHETIPALGQRFDVTLPIVERASQGCNLHPQVDLFDEGIRPDLCDQRFLVDHFTGVSDQDQQDIQCTPTQTQRFTVAQDLALSDMKHVGAEPQNVVRVGRLGCLGLIRCVWLAETPGLAVHCITFLIDPIHLGRQ
ncbi:Uncharacterized protein ALO52_05179 [Pseudomonas syringae pv. primulae]|uniref:Uncharacterized protein n=1 Tax=Pseudomonas syringae pv. primulae TaxID=251707 RepID=A0A0P9Y8V4_9PSED|nr:Uncharacterized protein ALO52_05179 [Pseudomonas syringae pv. primulae]